MGELRVFLCRHAQRDGDEDHISGVGKRDAYALGQALRQQYPEHGFLGLCSACLRTRETVAAILAGASASGAPITQDDALQNGEFDPRWAPAEVTSRNAALNVYLRFDDRRPAPHIFAPREVAARLARALHRFLTDAPAPPTMVAVTHSGMIEVFLAYLLDVRQIEAIGGSFGLLEGVALHLEERQGASLSLQISFRGWTYTIADDILWHLL